MNTTDDIAVTNEEGLVYYVKNHNPIRFLRFEGGRINKTVYFDERKGWQDITNDMRCDVRRLYEDDEYTEAYTAKQLGLPVEVVEYIIKEDGLA